MTTFPIRYPIGTPAWRATFDPETRWLPCPDCAGHGCLTVIMGDGEHVSIDCANCGRGWDPPTGHIQSHQRTAKAELVTVTGIEMKHDGSVEYRTTGAWCVDAVDLLPTEAEALARAQVIAAAADQEEAERIQNKEKDTRTWAWNVGYHRREIKLAEERIVYHKAKLAVASVKAKSDKILKKLEQS